MVYKEMQALKIFVLFIFLQYGLLSNASKEDVWEQVTKSVDVKNLRANYSVASLDDNNVFVGFGLDKDSRPSKSNLIISSNDSRKINDIKVVSSSMAIENAKVVSFKNKLWLIGGTIPEMNAGRRQFSNKVYFSDSNGAKWQEVPQFRNPNQYPLGQQCLEDLALDDISQYVKIPDFCTWWKPRESFGAVVLNGGMYIMGGLVYKKHIWSPVGTYERFNDVWKYEGSYDALQGYSGHKWKRLTRKSKWVPRSDFGCVTHNNEIFVAGGFGDIQETANDMSKGELLNDVFRTTLQISKSANSTFTWISVTREAEWEARASFGLASYKNKLYLSGGYGHDLKGKRKLFNDAWWSEDGKSWTVAIAYKSDIGARLMSKLVIIGHSFLAVGGKDNILTSHDTTKELKNKTFPITDVHLLFSSVLGCLNNGIICNGLGTCSKQSGECKCSNSTSDNIKFKKMFNIKADPFDLCVMTCNLGFEKTLATSASRTGKCLPCPIGKYGDRSTFGSKKYACFPCLNKNTTASVASVGRKSCQIQKSENAKSEKEEENNTDRRKQYVDECSLTCQLGFVAAGVMTLFLLFGSIFLVVKQYRSNYDANFNKNEEIFYQEGQNQLSQPGNRSESSSLFGFKKSWFFSSPTYSEADLDLSFQALSPNERENISKILNDCSVFKYCRIKYTNIQMIKIIGTGSFGEVLLGKYKGEQVAVKRLLRNRLNEECISNFAQEIELLINLRHENIVKCLGVSWNGLSDICVITEYMEMGDLHGVLCDTNLQLSWSNYKLTMALGAAQGLEYLHSHSPPVIHRDLKSMNILVDRTFNCKISDFGLSRTMAHDETMTATGSSLWFPPEMIRGEKFTEKADCYSFGVVLSEFDTRQLPYQDIMTSSENTTILTGTKIMHLVAYENLRPTISKSCIGPIRSLIQSCLEDDPEQRPNAQEIVLSLQKIQSMLDSISSYKKIPMETHSVKTKKRSSITMNMNFIGSI